jgi:hypothetical protein
LEKLNGVRESNMEGGKGWGSETLREATEEWRWNEIATLTGT